MEGALRKKLEKIKKHFEEIGELESGFTSEERGWMIDFHNEDATLQHCERWGLQASSELLEHLHECEICGREWIESEENERKVCDYCCN